MVITLNIPSNAKLLLKVNDRVDFNTPFYQSKNHQIFSLSVAKELNIPPDKIFRYLKKLVSDEIVIGDIIAEKSSLFSHHKITSQYNGIIKEIDHQLGNIIIEAYLEKESIVNCYFIGKVKDIDKQTTQIEIKAKDEYQIDNPPNNTGGEVVYFEKNHVMKADNINNKIIVAETIDDYDQVKLEALGAKLIITLKNDNNQSLIIKKLEDMKKILKSKYPYCLINQSSSKIIFYK